MKILNFVLLAAIFVFASTTIRVCNERTCYEQKLEISKYEWQRNSNGDKFLRIYSPDGTAVDITGKELKIDFQKSRKESKKKYK